MFDRDLDCFSAPGAVGLPVYGWRPGGWEAGAAALGPAVLGFLKGAGFSGTAGQIVLIPGPEGVAGAALGLGADRSFAPFGGLPMGLPEGMAWALEPGDFEMGEAVLGWCLGAYQYTRLRKPRRGPARLVCEAPDGGAVATARAMWLARDLINTPANLLGPSELAAATVALAERFGVVAEVVRGEALAREYPTVAAVAAGSERAGAVARFAWAGSGAGSEAPLLSLCGKGVVFDSGGYDLKPSSAMLRMKKDMGGAALMLALASRVMAADLPLRMEVRIGCVENMVSGGAMRPMDVLTTRRGLTVEIGNTDAEGRLVLCDLLAEASDQSPDLLIDAATLTGAARVALGPDIPALFCNDDGVAEAAVQAGADLHDPLWRLPLWGGYDPWLKSGIADLNNVAGKPMAGAIVAALFMRRFVAAGTPWMHVDTYAWNDSNRPGRPEGGEALGLRALFGTISRLKRFNPGDYVG